MLEILLIALGTLLRGGATCMDMVLFGRAKRDFLSGFPTFRHGIPSHDTFSRVFRLLDPDPFRRCFLAFMRRFAATRREEAGVVVALDGKRLRRSFDRAAAASPLHLVSVWTAEQRLVPGQLAVDGKSNATTAVPQLLAMQALVAVGSTAARPSIAALASVVGQTRLRHRHAQRAEAGDPLPRPVPVAATLRVRARAPRS